MQGNDSRLKQISKGVVSDADNTLAGVSTQYPFAHDSIHTQANTTGGAFNSINHTQRDGHGVSVDHSPLKSNYVSHPKNKVDQITANLNRKKFTTDKDKEAERLRLKDEQMKAVRANSTEPFWKDFHESISAVSKSKELAEPYNRHGKNASHLKQHAMKKAGKKYSNMRN